MRVSVRPQLFRWACNRSGRGEDYFVHRFPKYPNWLSAEAQPTYRQLQDFASASHTPIGFFFLPEPPVEAVPIPDIRTIANTPMGRRSPGLLVRLIRNPRIFYLLYRVITYLIRTLSGSSVLRPYAFRQHRNKSFATLLRKKGSLSSSEAQVASGLGPTTIRSHLRSLAV